MSASTSASAPPLDAEQARLLTALQSGVPLVARPFAALGEALGLSEEAVLSSARELVEHKLIRQLSPIYDTRRAGYDSALVAFEVAAEQLEHAAAMVSEHPGVSHNYERAHAFNLWFTLAVPPESKLGLEGTVAWLAARCGAVRSAVLRAQRTFKIGVKLALEEGLPEPATTPSRPVAEAPAHTPLTALEREVIRVTQEPLPLVAHPFAELAMRLGLGEEELLEILRDLAATGVMRRFAAILHHRRAGFVANGMAVWEVQADDVERAGPIMAAFSAVSHCYERTVAGGWPYRLFSMIHGRSTEEVERVVQAIREATGLTGVRVLYSQREFKKRRVALFSPALAVWEETALAAGAQGREGSSPPRRAA